MPRKNSRGKIHGAGFSKSRNGYSDNELKRLRKLYVKKSEDKDISKDEKKKSV